MGRVPLVFPVTLLLASSPIGAHAEPDRTARTFLDKATKTPKLVRQALCNDPGGRAGLLGLGTVLERGHISE